MSHAIWLHDLVNPKDLKIVCSTIAKQVKADRKNFGIDAIIVTGVSGNVIGGAISFLTGIPLIIVRKDEKNHSGYEIEYADSLDRLENLRYIIIDDLIDTGSTIKRIQEKIDRKFNDNKLMKIYLYNQSSSAAECAMQEGLDRVYPYFQMETTKED